jgi:hypothetical protein
MDGWIDGRMDRWTDGLMDGWIDGRMDRWTDGWMDGWITCLVRDKVMIYLKSVVYASREQQGAGGCRRQQQRKVWTLLSIVQHKAKSMQTSRKEQDCWTREKEEKVIQIRTRSMTSVSLGPKSAANCHNLSDRAHDFIELTMCSK